MSTLLFLIEHFLTLKTSSCALAYIDGPDSVLKVAMKDSCNIYSVEEDKTLLDMSNFELLFQFQRFLNNFTLQFHSCNIYFTPNLLYNIIIWILNRHKPENCKITDEAKSEKKTIFSLFFNQLIVSFPFDDLKMLSMNLKAFSKNSDNDVLTVENDSCLILVNSHNLSNRFNWKLCVSTDDLSD